MLGEPPATALIFIPPALTSDRAHPPHNKYLPTKSPMHAAKATNKTAFLVSVLARSLKDQLGAMVRTHAPVGVEHWWDKLSYSDNSYKAPLA